MAKYNKEIVKKICEYIRDGDSKKLASKKAGISESTFHEWANTKPEFLEAIKKAKEEFQETITGKLEATLWKRAMGYEVTETETEFVRDKEGNPVVKSQKKKVKHIQPDTGALIFALTNVAPDKWVNRQKTEIQSRIETTEDLSVFEDLPEGLLFEIADKIQQQQYEATRENKSE